MKYEKMKIPSPFEGWDYQVHVTEDLDSMQWTALPEYFSGNNTAIHLACSITGTSGNRMFFRVIKLPPLFAEDSNILIRKVSPLFLKFCAKRARFSGGQRSVVAAGSANRQRRSVALHVTPDWYRLRRVGVDSSRGEFRAGRQGLMYSSIPNIGRYIPAYEVNEAIHSGLEWSDSLSGSLAVYDTTLDVFGEGDFFDRSDGFLPIRTAFDDSEYFGWLRISHSLDNDLLTVHD